MQYVLYYEERLRSQSIDV